MHTRQPIGYSLATNPTKVLNSRFRKVAAVKGEKEINETYEEIATTELGVTPTVTATGFAALQEPESDHLVSYYWQT